MGTNRATGVCPRMISTSCDASTMALFEHRQAEQRFGASVFWIRPAMLFNESLESFVARWQIKRDGGRRGIVEVIL